MQGRLNLAGKKEATILCWQWVKLGLERWISAVPWGWVGFRNGGVGFRKERRAVWHIQLNNVCRLRQEKQSEVVYGEWSLLWKDCDLYLESNVAICSSSERELDSIILALTLQLWQECEGQFKLQCLGKAGKKVCISRRMLFLWNYGHRKNKRVNKSNTKYN